MSRGRWKGRRAESWQSYAGEPGQVGGQESRVLPLELWRSWQSYAGEQEAGEAGEQGTVPGAPGGASRAMQVSRSRWKGRRTES